MSVHAALESVLFRLAQYLRDDQLPKLGPQPNKQLRLGSDCAPANVIGEMLHVSAFCYFHIQMLYFVI